MILRIAGELPKTPKGATCTRSCASCSFESAHQILGVGDHGAEIPRHDGRRQHVEHAGAERLERALGPVRIDDADQHGLRALGADAARDAQRLAALRAVEQAEHRRPLAQLVERLARAGHPARGEPEPRQDLVGLCLIGVRR